MSNTEELIADLLEQWETLYEQGNDIAAEELAKHRPDLVPELKRRIKALKVTTWLNNPFGDDDQRNPSDEFDLPSKVGRYELQSLIGSGGFGQVWKSFDPELDRYVAIKIPRRDRIFETARFLEEARKVAQLKHVGIVPVHDVGQDGDLCFIVSDLIDGENLADHLKHTRYSFEESALLVANVGDALNYSHAQGIIHRDVKSHNILVDKEGRPHLTDFGIAMSESQSVQIKTATVGTLAYMSPEQADGQSDRVDSRTDIYSLGVVLYEMLAGRLPFVSNDPVELWASVVAGHPRTLRSLNSSIPISLERSCLKALSKKTEDRFSTAGDFSAALRQAVAEGKIRRWPFRIGMASVLVLLIIGGYWLRSSYLSVRKETKKITAASQKLTNDVLSKMQTEFGAESKNAKLEVMVPSVDQTPNAPKPSSSNNPVRISLTDSELDLSERTLTDDDFRAIADAFSLRSLNLANTNVTDKQFELLQSLITLEQLDLSGTNLGDKSIEIIRGFPALNQLSLANTKITDEGLIDLGWVPVRELDLSGTAISSKGIDNLCLRQTLVGMLDLLNLARTKVDEKSIPFLLKMNRLRHLTVAETAITETKCKELRQKMPKCEVVNDR